MQSSESSDTLVTVTWSQFIPWRRVNPVCTSTAAPLLCTGGTAVGNCRSNYHMQHGVQRSAANRTDPTAAPVQGGRINALRPNHQLGHSLARKVDVLQMVCALTYTHVALQTVSLADAYYSGSTVPCGP